MVPSYHEEYCTHQQGYEIWKIQRSSKCKQRHNGFEGKENTRISIDDQNSETLIPEAQKRVSKSVIFCTVLGIDPTFKISGGPGNKGSAGHLVRL